MPNASAGLAVTAARLPASLFAIPLGLTTLSAAWRSASRAYSVSPWLADALLVLAAAIWVVLFAALVAKAIIASGKLLAELRHPVEGSLAALAPASLLALAAAASAQLRGLAAVLFWIGAAWQVLLAVWIAGRWLSGAIDAKQVTPALYVPVSVASFLAAAAAGSVGRADVGWPLFGVGLLSWIFLGAVLLVRHLSEGELPPALRALLGLELAPPAFALVAWLALQGGPSDPAARVFLGFALFTALVLVRLAGRLREAPFGAAHWALAFPVAALSAASLRIASSSPGSIAGDLALPLFVVANAVVAAVAYKTVVALSRGKLLPPA